MHVRTQPLDPREAHRPKGQGCPFEAVRKDSDMLQARGTFPTALQLFIKLALEPGDCRFAALVEGPLLYALRPNQTCLLENPHVLGDGWLGDFQFLGDQNAAYP